MSKCQEPTCKHVATVTLTQDGKPLKFCPVCADLWLQLRAATREHAKAICDRLR